MKITLNKKWREGGWFWLALKALSALKGIQAMKGGQQQGDQPPPPDPSITQGLVEPGSQQQQMMQSFGGQPMQMGPTQQQQMMQAFGSQSPAASTPVPTAPAQQNFFSGLMGNLAAMRQMNSGAGLQQPQWPTFDWSVFMR